MEANDLAFEQKVLRTFFSADGRLKDLPSQPKKQWLVIRQIASKFEPDTQYTEPQVNEILRALHADFASLRRALIDFHFLERKDGLYWRSPNEPANPYA